MGDPTIVYGIITWEMNGPYLFTALLKVSYQLSHLTESLALRQVVRVSKNLCHRCVRACRIRVPMLLQRKIKTLYIWVIDQACSVKMAGHWPRFFACLWTEAKSRSINLQNKNEANIQQF